MRKLPEVSPSRPKQKPNHGGTEDTEMHRERHPISVNLSVLRVSVVKADSPPPVSNGLLNQTNSLCVFFASFAVKVYAQIGESSESLRCDQGRGEMLGMATNLPSGNMMFSALTANAASDVSSTDP